MIRIPDFMRDFGDYEKLQAAVVSLGYIWYRGDMAINFISLRTTKKPSTKFDDFFFCANEIGSHKRVTIFPGTTNAPVRFLRKGSNPAGIAQACTGQHVDAFMAGDHKGRAALRNDAKNPIAYQRYNPDTGILGEEVYNNYIGLHFHDAGSNRDGTRNIGGYSEGCQNPTYQEDVTFMRNQLIYQGRRGHGDKLTNTIIGLWELM